MRRISVIAGVLLAAGALVHWRFSPRLTDSQQIVQLILQVRRATETKNAAQLLSYISDEYNDGTFTKRDLTRLVVMAFRSPEPYRVQVEQPALHIQGNRATVDVKAKLWVGQPEAPEEQEIPLQVHAELVRVRGGWKVIRAKGWEPAATVGEQ